MRAISIFAATVVLAATANPTVAAPPSFGDPARLAAMPPGSEQSYPPTEATLIAAAIQHSAEIFQHTDDAYDQAWKAFWTDARTDAAQMWIGRLMATNVTMAGAAPEILLWPGLVARTAKPDQFGKPPDSYVSALDPLYRKLLVLPPGTPVLFSGKIESGGIDGGGAYPYPMILIVRFTTIEPVPDNYRPRP